MATPAGTAADHPGNDYYANVVTGTIQRQSNPALAKAMLLAGFTGPYTWAQAQAAVAGAKAASSALGIPGPGEGQALSKLNPVSGVSDFLARLGQANTWVRVAEVALGVILIAVGVAKITHVVPIATKIAGAVA